MKKIFTIVIVALSINCFAQEMKLPVDTTKVIFVKKDAVWGGVNCNGKVIVNFDYDNISPQWTNKLTLEAKKNNLFREDNIKIKGIQYDNFINDTIIKYFFLFKDINKTYYIFNRKGEQTGIYKKQDNCTDCISDGMFFNDLCIIYSNMKAGVINPNGKVIIPTTVYRKIWPFYNGYAFVMKKDPAYPTCKNCYIYNTIDKKGLPINKVWFDLADDLDWQPYVIECFNQKYYVVGQWSKPDSKGTKIRNRNLISALNGKLLLNFDTPIDNVKIKGMDHETFDIIDGKILVQKDKVWGLVDEKGVFTPLG